MTDDPRAPMQRLGVECQEVGEYLHTREVNSTHWCNPVRDADIAIRALIDIIVHLKPLTEEPKRIAILQRALGLCGEQNLKLRRNNRIYKRQLRQMQIKLELLSLKVRVERERQRNSEECAEKYKWQRNEAVGTSHYYEMGMAERLSDLDKRWEAHCVNFKT